MQTTKCQLFRFVNEHGQIVKTSAVRIMFFRFKSNQIVEQLFEISI